jgi:hypothetical protein
MNTNNSFLHIAQLIVNLIQNQEELLKELNEMKTK